MIRKLLSTAVILCLFAGVGQSQTIDTSATPVWIEMMQDPEANFFETQRAFEMYWQGRERQPGDGWKVFKRWEWYWSTRVNEDGTFPAPDQTKTAYDTWRAAYNQSMAGGIESTGGDWIEVGPRAKPNNGTGQPNGNGRVNTIFFHPTDSNTMWVGAPAGGLWKTTNYGVSWSSNTDQLATLGVSAILIDPNNTDVMYIGTGDRDAGDASPLGVYKSTDGGQTWGVSNTGMGNKTVGAMVMHPTNSSIIIAATSGGVYRTLNGGSSWTLESNGSNFKDLKYKPGSSTVLYATETSSGAGFYRSTDGGDSWTQITSGLPSGPQRYAIGVSEDDPTYVYLLCSVSSAFGGMYRSTNSGASFSTMSTTPNILGWAENGSSTGGQGWYDLCVAVDPNDANTVYAGGVNIFKSTNGGVSWDCSAHWVGSSTAASVHADQHWLATSPITDNIFVCNDGGVYYTTNGGATWPEISDSLGIAQIYRIGVSQQTNPLVLNGYQDNGTALWDDNIFRTERGGDGMESVIDWSDDNVMYASVYYGNIARSMNNGYSFSGFAANGTNGITESGAWVTPYILDNQDANIMFIGYKNVWRTTNAKASTPSFTQISSNLNGSNGYNIRQLRQSKANNNRLFMIRSDNRLFRTNNVLASSPTWTDLTNNVPGSGTMRDIETHPTLNGTAWIIRNNVVYKTSNGGVSWTTFSTGLPNVNKNCLVAHPYSDGGLYIGTDAGVYYIDNTLSSWIAFDDGMPATSEITELEIYQEQGNWEGSRIRAATYGRGLWESDLYGAANASPLAFVDFSLDTTDICKQDTIDLINNSAYGIDSTVWIITPSAGVSFVGGTDSNSMNARVILSEIGSYDVQLRVYNTNGYDSVLVEDALKLGGGTFAPWSDDFESNSLCSESGGCAVECDINNWRNLKNGSADDVDWRADNDGPLWSTQGTGPAIDYDPGTTSGIYLYVSTYPWTTCYNMEAHLESPCFLLENVTNPEIKFAYHRDGYSSWMGDLDLDIYSNGTWTNLITKSGVQSSSNTDWHLDSANLNSYIGENVKFRFVGHTGSGWQADIAIDAVELTAGPLTDFGVSDTMPCINTTVTLTDSSTQNPNQWTWTITPNTHTYVNGTNANSQHPEVSFNAPGLYNVKLKSWNNYGNDIEYKSSVIEVISPSVYLSSNSPSNEFCDDDTVIVTATSGLSNYAFYVNGSLQQSGASNMLTLTQFANGDSVSINVTDSSGCSSAGTILTVTVRDNPTAVLSSSDDDEEICEGDTVTITATSTMIEEYDFIRTGVSVQASASNQWVTDSLENNDLVYVVLTDTHGCHGMSDSLTFSVLPLPPTPSIMILLDSLNCTVMGDAYKWSFNDTITQTNSDMHAKSGDGTYRVRLFAGGCWSAWSEPFIITGYAELGNLRLKVFPSPSSDLIYINFLDVNETSEGQLSIIDMNGKTVIPRQRILVNESNQIELSISDLSAGIYHVILEVNEQKWALPIVKEKR